MLNMTLESAWTVTNGSVCGTKSGFGPLYPVAGTAVGVWSPPLRRTKGTYGIGRAKRSIRDADGRRERRVRLLISSKRVGTFPRRKCECGKMSW